MAWVGWVMGLGIDRREPKASGPKALGPKATKPLDLGPKALGPKATKTEGFGAEGPEDRRATRTEGRKPKARGAVGGCFLALLACDC